MWADRTFGRGCPQASLARCPCFYTGARETKSSWWSLASPLTALSKPPPGRRTAQNG